MRGIVYYPVKFLCWVECLSERERGKERGGGKGFEDVLLP